MNITFIGGGNMAGAIIGGLIAKGYVASELRVVDVTEEARVRIKRKYPGVEAFSEARAAVRAADVLVLAVKPQHMRDAASKLALTGNPNLVITIAAGIPLPVLKGWLGGHTRLVRAMPNTPALVGKGVSGLYADSAHVDAEDRSVAEGILGAVGATVWIDDEAKMDAVTAVSGSGPAYVFYFMEALERAAQELGLESRIARELVLHTFQGAADLAAASTDEISVLREQVTSKGGTTEAALRSMARDHVQDAIVRAVQAAQARGRELGRELAKQPDVTGR